MNEKDVRETMEQIHISEQMQEEIIMNILNQRKNGKNRTKDWKKMATVAAAFVLAVGVISFPIQAVVKNVVKARMESVSAEEMQDIRDTINQQGTVGDSFSREYFDTENERMKELWQSYERGMFPEKEICRVAHAEEVTEGALCYIDDSGVFHLPDREMTDEELLEIIDFQRKEGYAFELSPAAQEAKAEFLSEQERRRALVEAAGGISEEKAVEIATEQLKAELKDAAWGMMDDMDVFLEDISEVDFDHTSEVAYLVSFGNPDDKSTYSCMVDPVDGSILNAVAYIPAE